MKTARFPVYTQISSEPITIYKYLDARVFDYPFFNDGVVHRDTQLQCHPTSEEDRQVLQLSGFIFHTAHCGSTLLSRMLSASPRVRSISESEAINGLLLTSVFYDISEDEIVARLKKIVADYLQKLETEEYAIFKLTSWNAFFLPLFQKAFPTIPWMYIDRETDAVVQTLFEKGHGFTEWWDHGSDILRRKFIPQVESPSSKYDFIQKMVEIKRAAITTAKNEQTLIVKYPDFLARGVFEKTILPYFGITFSKEELEQSFDLMRYDSKSLEKELYVKGTHNRSSST